MRDNYTRYPRPILWLLREGELQVEARRVRIAPFYLSKAPVTNRQFEAMAPSFRRSAASSGDDDPATGIDYAQAVAYCTWYAAVSRKAIRLPTDEEWEYACRAGREASGAAVSGGRANAFGLISLPGGVWEWTASGALRGGSFRTPRARVHCGLRRVDEPGAPLDDVGFRIARSFESGSHAPEAT